MNYDLCKRVDSFKNKRIAVFGDVMLDAFMHGFVNRISPEAPVPVLDLEYMEYLPGGAANTANNIKSLGGEPLLFGVVGDDVHAKKLYELFDSIGISKEYIIVDRNRPTSTKTRLVGVAQHGKQQLLRLDQESKKPISKEIEEKVLRYAEDVIKSVDGVTLSDYGKGFLTDSLCINLIRLCKTYNKTVIVDPKADFSKYRGATMITPNMKEFIEYSGARDEREALRVIEENGLEALLITKGSDGMSLYEKNGRVANIPAVNNKNEVIDITGAGDTAVASFVLAISAGAELEEAEMIANYAAGVVVRKEGTSTTTIDELKNEIRGVNNGRSKKNE